MSNKTKDWLTDYYKTGRKWDKENREKREARGEKEPRGLKNLNSFEKGCIALIILGLLGFFVKIVILGHGFMSPGL